MEYCYTRRFHWAKEISFSQASLCTLKFALELAELMETQSGDASSMKSFIDD